mgnify:CR=1 FL=1
MEILWIFIAVLGYLFCGYVGSFLRKRTMISDYTWTAYDETTLRFGILFGPLWLTMSIIIVVLDYFEKLDSRLAKTDKFKSWF